MRPYLHTFGLILSVLITSSSAWSQRLKSPEVNADGSITFRTDQPAAETIEIQFNRVPDDKSTVTLTKDENGKWLGTSRPLAPGIYEYKMIVDGTAQLDIRNRWIKKWYTLENLVEVPGDPSLVTERQSVDHGVLHHHYYQSAITNSQRQVIVYTPPSYASHPDKRYPVLFLLHGFGDDQTAWTEVGRANLIADNLIHGGTTKEMIIVMPHGHPVPLPHGTQSKQARDDYGKDNNLAMRRDLIEVLLPWVRSNYRTLDTIDNRAIAGLSMGGGHSIRTALASNEFAYVGAYSAAAPQDETLDDLATDLDRFKMKLKHFWIACGDEDFLLERNQAFVKQLKAASIPHVYLETQGAHNWDVWRDDYLPRFLPMLFQDSAASER
ncbi:alpha/beta hydrolase-fold protein [Roseiconus lacunae]|uniref:Alpha/beta hydrolase-fold protein n=1 Tax=Roseiconus lacunae TaxID=2605694 RepID=A0ABT7PPI9_9BACT|nr:alpha/beta hydrolase-fold protein [Roseiconus lacunae]MDM4018418.1 alpha/beta hydrolase-fold protein [Roseiconus lacunae]